MTKTISVALRRKSALPGHCAVDCVLGDSELACDTSYRLSCVHEIRDDIHGDPAAMIVDQPNERRGSIATICSSSGSFTNGKNLTTPVLLRSMRFNPSEMTRLGPAVRKHHRSTRGHEDLAAARTNQWRA
jgi:hypothetical protein